MSNQRTDKEKLTIGIITIPVFNTQGSYFSILSNLLLVLSPSVDKIVLVTSNFPEDIELGNNIQLNNINLVIPPNKKLFPYVRFQILYRVHLIISLFKLRNTINGPVFILSSGLLIPILIEKVLGKKTILTAVASYSNLLKYHHPSSIKVTIKYFMIKYLEDLTYLMSDYIVGESSSVFGFIGIKKKSENTLIGKGNLFILHEKFKPIKDSSERKNIIGYIGRFSYEKGILNLVFSIPHIIEKRSDIHFLLIGDGPLRNTIEKYITEHNISDNVTIINWIPHEQLPQHLNEIKLMVLPSYTEGVPNILLESMACGVVVVATHVGGIPDFIIDGKTGFLIDNNSPDAIAIDILRALNSPNFNEISYKCSEFIKSEFTLENAIKRYKNILKQVQG